VGLQADAERFDVVEWSRTAKSEVACKQGFRIATPEELARIISLVGGKIAHPPEDLRKTPRKAGELSELAAKDEQAMTDEKKDGKTLERFDAVEWSRRVKQEISEEMAAGTFRAPTIEDVARRLGIPATRGSREEEVSSSAPVRPRNTGTR
jgi:hypothetical protein